MTIPELIADVLGAINRQFYPDRVREFMRDERALTKALARYGYECHQRGWEFSVPEIKRDLMALLNEIKRTGTDIKYLPTYLEGAVRRHIGQRAEELSAAAKLSKPHVNRIVKGAEVVVVVTPDNTAILSSVYSDIRRIKKQRAKEIKQSRLKPAARQESLL